MRRTILVCSISLVAIPMLLVLDACGKVQAQVEMAKEAPPAVNFVPDVDVTLFSVDHPEQFPVATATEHPLPRS